MNHPEISARNGNQRHMRMIKEAEEYRRIKAISGSRPKMDIFPNLWKILKSLLPREVEKSTDPAA
jgi:hypothetical protein